jgi:16S rRNA (cytosine1402-N4)-methyltransferase
MRHLKNLEGHSRFFMNEARVKEREMIHHTPVLQNKILDLLKPPEGSSLFVDATLGEGGYAEAFLDRFSELVLLGVDRDLSILEIACNRLSRFGKRVHFFNMWFDHFFEEYEYLIHEPPDRIIFDLGISRFHFEEGNRGFSFNKDEPLDMRLSDDIEINASDIVNSYTEPQLCHIFAQFGEERYAKTIAHVIVRERKKQAIRSSLTLARIIEGAIPSQLRYRQRIHPATRCFQALRIEVNKELERLERGIVSAFTILKPGGRLGVLSYHSLEDRIVKLFFKEKNKDCTCPPEWPICQCRGERECVIMTKKPVRPDEAEIRKNHAARSARLRVIEKCMTKQLLKGDGGR